jgi:hypothetical protein
MKRLTKCILCLLCTILCALVNADTVSISFTSLQIPTGTFAPERDVIVYVVNSSSEFVRTIATWGTDLDDDIPWMNVSSGSKVDAVSGATIKGTAAQQLKTSWDGKDANKTIVTNGSYWLIISANSRDRNISPSRLKIKLDVGGAAKTITSADSSISNGSGCLTDLSIMFTSTSNKMRNYLYNATHKTLLVGKNDFYISNNNQTCTVSLFTLSGRCIYKQILSVSGPDKSFSIPVQHILNGTYMCVVTTETSCISKKIVLTHR